MSTAAVWEVIVVLDACTDDTAGRVAEAAARHPQLPLHVLRGPGRGAGPARRVGMDAAAARLAPDGLIACTDADSTVAPDWVAAQLAAAAAGARAIGGRIEIAPAEMAALPPGRGPGPAAGASVAVTGWCWPIPARPARPASTGSSAARRWR